MRNKSRRKLVRRCTKWRVGCWSADISEWGQRRPMGRAADGVDPPLPRRGVIGMRPAVRAVVAGGPGGRGGGVFQFGGLPAISQRRSFPRRATVFSHKQRERFPRCVAKMLGAASGAAKVSSSDGILRDVHRRHSLAMAYGREPPTCGRSGAKRPPDVLPNHMCKCGEVHAA